MTPPIGHRATCKACGRELVRIEINAPFGSPDYTHLTGRACPGSTVQLTESPAGRRQGSAETGA